MSHKLFLLGGMWILVVAAYIIMAVMMPAITEIVSTANTSLVASANMSDFPGTLEAVNSAPLWLWFIPGGVALVVSVIMLKR